MAVEHFEAIPLTGRVADTEAMDIEGQLATVTGGEGPLHRKTRWGRFTLFSL